MIVIKGEKKGKERCGWREGLQELSYQTGDKKGCPWNPRKEKQTGANRKGEKKKEGVCL